MSTEVPHIPFTPKNEFLFEFIKYAQQALKVLLMS